MKVGCNGTARLAVASYNVHRCVGRDRRWDPERTGAVLRELAADVIGLQEVDSGFGGRGTLDQIGQLAEAGGFTAGVAGPTMARRDGHYGNALLSRHPVTAVRLVDLSVDGREPRGALDVDLDVRGRRVQVVVTHFGLGAQERRRQARRLLESVPLDAAHPIVLLGDFNEWLPGGGALRLLRPHFVRSPSLRTFPSRRPVLALDRIWIRPGRTLDGVRVHGSAAARVASDHLPLRADVAL